jgi:hypothetical protein
MGVGFCGFANAARLANQSAVQYRASHGAVALCPPFIFLPPPFGVGCDCADSLRVFCSLPVFCSVTLQIRVSIGRYLGLVAFLAAIQQFVVGPRMAVKTIKRESLAAIGACLHAAMILFFTGTEICF